jgi:hypothetical protein
MVNVAVDAVIVKVRLTDLVCAGFSESVTVNVTGVALADAVGVPVIAPEVAFNDRPLGNVPEVSFQL